VILIIRCDININHTAFPITTIPNNNQEIICLFPNKSVYLFIYLLAYDTKTVVDEQKSNIIVKCPQKNTITK